MPADTIVDPPVTEERVADAPRPPGLLRRLSGAPLAFVVTVVAYVIGWAAYGSYPFGGKNRAISDQITQIVPFHKYLWDVVHGQAAGDLFFNWQTGLGQQFLANYDTYLGNPLSLLVVLVPRSHVDLAVFVITPLTMGLAAAAMAAYLGHLNAGSPALRAVLGCCYALCGWAVGAASYLPMWLWGLVALPLICIGVEWAVQGRRWLGLTGLVALSWFGNYYTAMMATFAAAIILLIRLATLKMTTRGRILALLRAGTAVAAGVALTLPLLLPSFLSSRASQPTDAPHFMPVGPRVFLASMLPGNYLWGVPPRLWIVSLGLILALTFIVNRRIAARTRLVWTVGVLLTTASFQWAPTQYLWHGLAVPNGTQYRETFVLAGLLTMVAWMSLANRPTVLMSAGAGLVLVLAAVLVRNVPDFNPTTWVAVIGGGAVSVLALSLYAFADQRRVLAALAVVLMLGGVIAESALTTETTESRRARETWASAGPSSGPAMQAEFQATQSLRDWPAYRTDPLVNPYTSNDSLTLRAEGPEYYSSYTPETTSSTLTALGLGWKTSGRTTVSIDNPVTDAIFAIGARVYPGGATRRFPAPPLVTVRPAQPPQPTGDTPFAAQEAALGAVVYQVPPVHVSGPVKRNAELTVTTTCRPGSGVYWYSPRLNGPLTQNGARSQSVKNGVRGQAGMVPVGTVPASGKVDVSFTPTASGPLPQFPIGCLDQKALTAAVDHLKATGATDVKAGGHSIEATLPAGSTGVAVIAAPALKGWQCGPRDGALTTPQTWSGLLAVPLTPGTTAVRCVFTPPGFRPGLAAAGLALLAILAVQGFTFWRRRTS